MRPNANISPLGTAERPYYFGDRGIDRLARRSLAQQVRCTPDASRGCREDELAFTTRGLPSFGDAR